MRLKLFISIALYALQVLPCYSFSYSGGDTLRTKTNPGTGCILPSSLSLIDQMDDNQLLKLVELLFELDSIPADLSIEINRVMETRRENAQKLPIALSEIIFEIPPDSIPAKEYYTDWDTKHTHYRENNPIAKDSTFLLCFKNNFSSTYVHPTAGIITSQFGWRDSAMHNGIDIDLNKGDPVFAAFEGKVRIARREGGYGNVVIIRHSNGLETYYAHLWKIKVKEGQWVKAGQTIGLGGSTGRTTGSHLHFETRFKGMPVNPKYFISFAHETLLSEKFCIKKTRHGICAFPFNATTYKIEKGDTLFEIAKRFGTTTSALKNLNGFKSNYVPLKVGQELIIAK